MNKISYSRRRRICRYRHAMPPQAKEDGQEKERRLAVKPGPDERIPDYTPLGGRKYLTTVDLVRITGIPATTWQKWRSLKKGPRYRKFGRKVFYDPEDIRQWDKQQLIRTE